MPDQTLSRPDKSSFTEAGAWESVGDGWRRLSGDFNQLGYSVEWHDFTLSRDLDWSGSFHPRGLEICLNVAGNGEVRAGGRVLELGAFTAGFYLQSGSRLAGLRRGGGRHQFATIEFSLPFLEHRLRNDGRGFHPRFHSVLRSRAAAEVSERTRLSAGQQQIVMSLRQPPVCAGARRLWYEAKALELAAALLYRPAPGEELFCERVKRLNQERVQKVVAILGENLSEPPTLEQIGRKVGCSHFYLSRIFTQEMGKSISAHLRDLRMERAAELLRQGTMNVTQVALEVGYSSLSHFTATFRETFACCPGLYPLNPAGQTMLRRRGEACAAAPLSESGPHRAHPRADPR